MANTGNKTKKVATKATEVKEEVKKAPEPKKEATVMFAIDRRPGDPDSIFVGVNGKSYQIRTGELVELPMSVYKVLQTSAHQTRVAEAYQEKFKDQEIASL